MKTLKTLAAAGVIASTMALAPAGAQAQTDGSGFDGYRVVAVTAGVIVGATVAAIVTDGLIIPAYYYVAGGTAAGGAMAGGAAAAEGAMMGGPLMHTAYQTFRGGMRVLGAVGGGFYADAWYTGR
jgi:hypothetical protein